jgi:hypothetical protein
MDSTIWHFPSRLCGPVVHIKFKPFLFPVSCGETGVRVSGTDRFPVISASGNRNITPEAKIVCAEIAVHAVSGDTPLFRLV